MAMLHNVEASCAICGASSQHTECPHESASLELAVDQALTRWTGLQKIRHWAMVNARNQVVDTFSQLKAQRHQAHMQYLQTLPCYTLYQKYADPPLTAPQKALWQQQMAQAQAFYQSGIDEDWRRCCLKYPDILDHYLSLVEYEFPDNSDPAMREPRFGVKDPKRIKARRGSMEHGSGHRKRSRRRGSRGRTPPAAPMVGTHRR